jgi:DNA (cytosine-5)-methyltransferase 1
MLRVAELFTGTGAFSLAFKNVSTDKFKVVYANDFEPSSKTIFDANNDIVLDCKDLNEVKKEDIPEMDILTAGFPCQPFSVAGKRNGFNDPRSNVFWKIIEILNHHKPRLAILENVKNLQSHDKGNTFETISNALRAEGYYVKYKVLNTCNYTNIPQNRERIYILCFREETDYTQFEFPEPLSTPRASIVSLLTADVPNKYYYSVESAIWEKLAKSVVDSVDTNTIYQYRRYYVRQNKSGCCPTLTANMGTGGHNVPIIKDNAGIRKLTPYECFKLQGFPDNYIIPNLSDAKLYKLAGNAVSVPVIKRIIELLEM